MSRFALFIFIALLSFLLIDCRKDKYVKPVCFDTDVLPILNNKCAMSGCHNSIDKQKGLDLSSYEGFSSSKEKDKVLEAINEGKMPPAPLSLTKEEKQILARWAAQGYSRGECAVTAASCDTSTVTYTNGVKQIFDTYCTGCHNMSNQSGGYALDTYMDCKNCANSGRLMGALKWLSGYSAMPKSGNKLSDCNIAKIQRWINSGKPN